MGSLAMKSGRLNSSTFLSRNSLISTSVISFVMSLGVGRTAPTCKEVCCKPAGFHSVRGVSSLLPAVLGAKYTYFLKTQQFLWYLCRKVYMMPDNSTPRKTLHPRNIHLAGYDFKKLTKVNPALRDYMITTPDGRESVDFSHPSAVLQLNKSLLSAYYNVANRSEEHTSELQSRENLVCRL